MSRGILGYLFDFNRDGNVDSWERAVEMMAIDDMEAESLRNNQMWDEEEEEIEEAGLDYDDLALMDDEERREALEEAGLDPDDYDF